LGVHSDDTVDCVQPLNGLPQFIGQRSLCQVRNRAGKPCRCAAVKGKTKFRLHGGAKGSGAPKGERNGMWKHGCHSKEAVA